MNINYNLDDENHLNETNLGEVQSITDVNRPEGKYNYLCGLLSIVFFNCWLVPSQVSCINYLSNCIGSELSSKIRDAMQTSLNVWNTMKTRKGPENSLKDSTTLKVKRRKKSDEEMVIINRGLIHFLITYNIDFKCIESNYFDDFMKALRPEYTFPNYLDLTTNILNEAYDHYKNTKFDFKWNFIN